MNARAIEKFVSECETKMYELHKDCLTPGNPPPRIRVLHSNEETYRDGMLEKGSDSLGMYDDLNNEITIFDKNIENFAHHSGLEEDLIREVVLIHEIAHSVTHLGLHDDKSWENFGRLENRVQVEHSAQLASWLYIKKYAPHLMSTFEGISRKSFPWYREWETVVKDKGGQFERVFPDYKKKLLDHSGRSLIDKSEIDQELEE